MDTTSSPHSQPIGIELEYDGRICFYSENTHGAKIYRDYLNCNAVKVEDHFSEFDTAPWVNFQGDHYMGRTKVCM